MFQEAQKLVSQTKEKELDELVVKVIYYEEKLIKMKNVESHTISEALL